MKIEESDDGWHNTAYFTVHIETLSPVASEVEIEYDDCGAQKWSTSAAAGEQWHEHTFAGNLLYVKAAGYRIKVSIEDKDNNTLEYEKSFDGLFSGALRFLEDIWNHIVGAFHEAMKAVQAAANALITGFKEIVLGVIEKLLNGIKGEALNVIKGILEGLERDPKSASEIILGNDVMKGAIAAMIGLTAVDYAITATGIGGLILTAISVGLYAMLKTGAIKVPGFNFGLEGAKEHLGDWMMSVINGVTGGVSESGVRGFRGEGPSVENVVMSLVPTFLNVLEAIALRPGDDTFLLGLGVGLNFVIFTLSLYGDAVYNWAQNVEDKINITERLMALSAFAAVLSVIGIGLSLFTRKFLPAGIGVVSILMSLKSIKDLSDKLKMLKEGYK
jgi:hypothetical protein